MNMHVYYDDVDYKQEREKQRTHIKEMLEGLVQPTKPADLIPVIAEKRCMEAYAVNFKGSKGALPQQDTEGGGSETVTPEAPDASEPEPETEPEPDPIVRKDWEKSTNTMPNDKALKEDGTLKMGTGVRGTYATVANDGVIELSLIPTIPGRKILGPSGDGDIFTKTEEGDVSCFFGVTSLEHPLKDVIGLYDSITLDVISDGEIIQTMDLQLHNDGWFDKNGEMLEGTYIDEYTIQEATRVSFYAERGKEHKFVLSANSKENNESIEVTVIDEYVDSKVPVDPKEPKAETEGPGTETKEDL